MKTHYYYDIEQGSDEWMDIRRGLLTASEMKQLVTPTLKVASNDKQRTILLEIIAENISGYTEPTFISADMERGHFDEGIARDLYSEHYAPVTECGFITSVTDDYVIGYSPDGLVGDDGLIEIKSRRQKYQVQTISNDTVPKEHMMQLQTGLFVTGRKWIDYVSYCEGLPMFVKRVEPDEATFEALQEAVSQFYMQLDDGIELYNRKLVEIEDRLTPTERFVHVDEDVEV